MKTDHDRIRIALAITELPVGGAERCLTNLALGLNRERFDPQVYSFAPRPQQERAQLVERLEQAGIPVHFLGVTSSLQFLSAKRRFRQLLEKQRPAILQTFLFHANVMGALVAKSAGVQKLITGVRVCDPRNWRHRVERMLMGRVDQVVCVSQSVAEFSGHTAQLPRQKLMVIPNGIDPVSFPAHEPADLTKFGIPAGRRVIVYIGRLHEQKGVDWMLQLAPRFLEQLDNTDLLLVGDGPMRADLQQQAKLLGIADRVHFVGRQPCIAQILRASSLLILPSRWEGMPNVLMEAMASSKPVVSTRAAGVRELLGPLTDDESVELEDTDEFVRKITEISQSEALAASLGERNRDRVSECFPIEAMIAAYESLYLTV